MCSFLDISLHFFPFTLLTDVNLIADVFKLSFCESWTWSTVPAATSVTHDEFTFVTFLAITALISFFSVRDVALLA